MKGTQGDGKGACCWRGVSFWFLELFRDPVFFTIKLSYLRTDVYSVRKYILTCVKL